MGRLPCGSTNILMVSKNACNRILDALELMLESYTNTIQEKQSKMVKTHKFNKELILDWLEDRVGGLFEQWEAANEELRLSEHLTEDEVYDKLSIVMACEAQLGLLNELTNLISDEGVHSVQ